MPVPEGPYYFVTRYYGPTPKLNGTTAIDFFYEDGRIKRSVVFR